MLSIKKTCAALFATALLGVGIAAPASAANNSRQNGLVNVSIGDVSVPILNNANVGIAANVAAAVCGVKVGPVAVLAANTATTGAEHTVCTIGDQAVTLTQSQ